MSLFKVYGVCGKISCQRVIIFVAVLFLGQNALTALLIYKYQMHPKLSHLFGNRYEHHLFRNVIKTLLLLPRKILGVLMLD